MPLRRALNIPRAILSLRTNDSLPVYETYRSQARRLPRFGCHPTREGLDWGGVCSICGRALPSRELSDLNYKSWTLAFSSCAHKFRLYTSLLRLSFARKGVGKSRRVCCFNKTLKVLLFRLHFVFYQSYCRGLLCRLVPALTSLAIRNTTMAVFVGGRECTGGVWSGTEEGKDSDSTDACVLPIIPARKHRFRRINRSYCGALYFWCSALFPAKEPFRPMGGGTQNNISSVSICKHVFTCGMCNISFLSSCHVQMILYGNLISFVLLLGRL